ncbi:hypothetical protein [Lichenibacterium dinghuense]|uniref:hypothetical protein n=1 Tax=Lichenibacterium dinghuense TaxID=2895977 RepID=UPI001F3646BB|nr:hypothetical protein [Lichenibacterium sp. 6Y81]
MEHGAHFDLIMGFWGEAARDEDRLSVSLEYHIVDGIPSFMVIDARPRPFAQAAIAGRALDRSEVIGTDMAGFAFKMVDAIALGDDRLAELFPGLCEAEASHQVQ